MNADVAGEIILVSGLNPTNLAANTNGSTVDLEEAFGKVEAFLSTGNVAGNDVVLTAFIQTSSDNGNWSNANIAFSSITNANTSASVSIPVREVDRFVRGRITIAGNNTPAQISSLVFAMRKASA